VIFIPYKDTGHIVTGAASGVGNAYLSGEPDFTSGFQRCPCYPVSLFHVIVLSFGLWVFMVPLG